MSIARVPQVSKGCIDQIAEESCGAAAERPKKGADHGGERPRRTPSQNAPAAGAEDISLVTAMAGRLRHAEQATAAVREELRSRNAEISRLKAELAAARGAPAGAASGGSAEPARQGEAGAAAAAQPEGGARELQDKLSRAREMLRRADERNRALEAVEEQKRALEAENREMKRFLRDYGMTWVGAGGAGGGTGQESTPPEDPVKGAGMWEPAVAQGGERAGAPGPPEGFDPTLILSNVKKLNFVAGEGEKEVAVGADGIRRLREKAVVSYVFYADGVWARGGPLRPYGDRASAVLVRDLTDGYALGAPPRAPLFPAAAAAAAAAARGLNPALPFQGSLILDEGAFLIL
jgi:hypothetical protein